jgi:hypothetical protein
VNARSAEFTRILRDRSRTQSCGYETFMEKTLDLKTKLSETTCAMVVSNRCDAPRSRLTCDERMATPAAP